MDSDTFFQPVFLYELGCQICFLNFVYGTGFLCGGVLLQKQKAKRAVLAMTVFICLSILFIFKYLNFVVNSIDVFFAIKLHPMTVKLLLPVGISFYTFQTVGYLVDVYRHNVTAERHFGKYLAFLMFFPQLVAGPIERACNLLPQIKKPRDFEYGRAVSGMKLILWGLFKKTAVADNLAIYVDQIYNDIYSYRGFAFVIATFFFTLQLYCDFSGYSDIARGTARLLGVELTVNFKFPYFSSSIKEFWSRWHISLSTWLRDYIYIPLGGNRKGKIRKYINLLITFIISGLWHGANWTFIVWGGYHGTLQVIESIIFPSSTHKHIKLKCLRSAITFLLVMAGWSIFRVQNIGELGYIVQHVLDGSCRVKEYIGNGIINIGIGAKDGLKIMAAVITLLAGDLLAKKGMINTITYKLPCFLKWGCCLLFVLFMIFLIPVNSSKEFIYFQF